MLISSSPKSAQDVLDLHKQRYNAGIQDGTIVPFTYPMFTVGVAVVIAFMLVHPSNPIDTPIVRWAVFGFITYWHIWMTIYCRSFNVAPTFGIGLVGLCLVLWAATTLIFHDSKREFCRIESKTYVRYRAGLWGFRAIDEQKEMQNHKSPAENGHSLSPPRPSLKKMHGRSNLKLMAKAQVSPQSPPDTKSDEGEYFWQGYPSGPFIERLDWVADLYSSFRGTGWNWLIVGLPGPPAHIQRQLADNKPAGVIIPSSKQLEYQADSTAPLSRAGVPRFDNFRALMSHSTYLLVTGYIIIDACKTYITHDPHFWGLIDAPPPSFLPVVVKSSWLLTRTFRLFISMTVIWISLRTIFCLAPVFYVGLLGSKRLGPRGEPWNYPDHYGAYANVLRRGLAGWWGGWWHQTFRFIFEAASTWTLRQLGMQGREKSPAGLALSMWVAFGLSGLLHACGSSTQMGDTRPWSGPFLFFMLQPVGLLVENAWRKVVLVRLGWKGRVPWPAAYAANFVWVHAWGLLVAPILVNDFARGGLWLFEPFPISLFRGLGLGAEGYGFWAWGGEWARWHWDKQGRWWMSGIAL